MNDSIVSPKYITRNAFQWILHQALVADEQYIYCGLIGVSPDEPEVIQHVAMVKDVADAAHTQSVWQDCNIKCIGLFHFVNEAIYPEVLAVVPEHYIALKASLGDDGRGEKGRLDLLAYQCEKQGGSMQLITLDLIEDGHKADAA